MIAQTWWKPKAPTASTGASTARRADQRHGYLAGLRHRQTTLHDARLFYAWFSGRQVRAVRLPVNLPPPSPDELGTRRRDQHDRGPIVVEVAELLDRRELQPTRSCCRCRCR
jgi:hypothetical protein